METLGDRVHLARKHRGFSCNKVDELVGFGAGTTSRIERGVRSHGERGIGTELLMRIAGALSVRPEWLLTGAGSMEDVAASDPYPRRALAIRIAKEGGIAEAAIEAVSQVRLTDGESKSTLWWIDAIRAREAVIKLDTEVSPRAPRRIASRK